MYTLYIVRCADSTLYTGITTDLQRRIREHNSSKRGARYTRSRRPVRVVYIQRFRSRVTASRAEAKMKKLSRAEKLKVLFRSRHRQR